MRGIEGAKEEEEEEEGEKRRRERRGEELSHVRAVA